MLPPYQQYGIGSALVEKIYKHYLSTTKCKLMVVEDPADDFQRMKDVLDIKMILSAGFFRSIIDCGLQNPSTTIDLEMFKLISIDHKEVSEIRNKLKLKKENVLRCFELLQIACLPEDNEIHEAYRKYVLRKFAESRDLLLPYFTFENFAEKSVLTNGNHTMKSGQQPTACCLGNGQLICLTERFQNQQAFLSNKRVNQK